MSADLNLSDGDRAVDWAQPIFRRAVTQFHSCEQHSMSIFMHGSAAYIFQQCVRRGALQTVEKRMAAEDSRPM